MNSRHVTVRKNPTSVSPIQSAFAAGRSKDVSEKRERDFEQSSNRGDGSVVYRREENATRLKLSYQPFVRAREMFFST